MANLFNMMKQAGSIKKDMKKMQKQLAGQTVEFSSAGGQVKVVARGDMTIAEVSIDPEFARKPGDGLEKAVVAAVNGALAVAKKEAGKEMSKLAGGLGLGDLMGGL
jgi:DNA-binding YbaB/EbfC family protein